MRKLKNRDIAEALYDQRQRREVTSSAEIPARALIILGTTGLAAKATASAINVVGCEANGQIIPSAKKGEVQVSGVGKGIAGEVVEAGKKLKALVNGGIGRLVDADLAGQDIVETETGGNFGNQPANDTVNVKSASASDITQYVTVYGLENGGSLTTEVIGPLTGTTPVTGSTSFDRIHAVTIDAVTVGNVTVEEDSGDADIVVITAGTVSVGIKAPTDTRAYNVIPLVFADGASTKYLAVYGTDAADAAQSEEIQLAGATHTVLANAYKTITALHVGDCESARAASIEVGAEEDEQRCVGISLEAAVAAGILEYKIS